MYSGRPKYATGNEQEIDIDGRMKVARILMRLGNKQAGKEIGLFNVIFKVITPDKVVTVNWKQKEIDDEINSK